VWSAGPAAVCELRAPDQVRKASVARPKTTMLSS
jgi:hypothetical protein